MNSDTNNTIAAGWIDRVLDEIVNNGGQITGEVRHSHRQGWVSALHVITEKIVGDKIDIVSGGPHYTSYQYVSASVLFLEQIGIVRVTRAYGNKAARANLVEVIEVVYS